LLQPEFPGRKELLEQVEDTQGSSDAMNAENGGLRFLPASSPAAQIPKTIFGTSGQGTDIDGSVIYYSLTFRQGKLAFLTIHKSVGEEVKQHPAFSNIRVSLDPPPQQRRKS
jgi:hypothetical protein